MFFNPLSIHEINSVVAKKVCGGKFFEAGCRFGENYADL